MIPADWAGEAGRVLREQAGIDLAALTPTSMGESGAAFWITDRTGTVMLLKIVNGRADDAMQNLGGLEAMTGLLRDRGYPAPRILATGQAGGLVFWVQERLPGATLTGDRAEPRRGVLGGLLPELIRLNDAQAGLGHGQRGWPELITTTLTAGGDGYCVHSTLEARSDTRELLPVLRRIGDSCGPAIPDGGDFVHFDFTFANLLSDGAAITGVIDINPPVLAGDRAFDLATLQFYGYDLDDLRTVLRARMLELSGVRACRAYLAHMVLRQVDWTVRHHPGSAATARHLRLARLVMADITSGPLS